MAGNERDTNDPSRALADMGQQLLTLADTARDASLGRLRDEIAPLARRNPLLLLVGSLTLGFELCRSREGGPWSSRYLNERPHDWGHSPAAHAEAAGDEEPSSSDEPDAAPGRVGDLRHQGEALHDKVGDLGQGQPAQPQPPNPPGPGDAESALRLQAARPLVLGALGVAAGALLAALLPAGAEEHAPAQPRPGDEPGAGDPSNGVEPMPRRSRPGPC
ncbi:MAG TPA: hypothetical protein VK019_02860 [Pseudomonas sp.]|nr:hypothetical protein [Pseudomonas sp.]